MSARLVIIRALIRAGLKLPDKYSSYELAINQDKVLQSDFRDPSLRDKVPNGRIQVLLDFLSHVIKEKLEIQLSDEEAIEDYLSSTHVLI